MFRSYLDVGVSHNTPQNTTDDFMTFLEQLCSAVILEPKWSNTNFGYDTEYDSGHVYTTLVNGEVLYHAGASR